MAKKFYDDIFKKYDQMVKTPNDKIDKLLYPNGAPKQIAMPERSETEQMNLRKPFTIQQVFQTRKPATVPGYNPERTIQSTFSYGKQEPGKQNPAISMPNVTGQLMRLPGYNTAGKVDNSIRFEGTKPQTTGAAKASTDYYWAKTMLDPENAWRDYKGASNMYFTQQRFGIQNNPGDNNIYLMSVDQLQEERKKQEKAREEALRKEEAYKNRTPEQIAAERKKVYDASRNQGKLGIFTNFGVPYGRNRYGDMMAVDPETYDANDSTIEYMKERPEDYWEATNRFQYDRLAYDFLNGAGAYDERVDQLETDEESDELDQEMDKIWDAIESGEIENQYQKAQEDLIQQQEEESGNFGYVKSQEEIDRIGDEISRRETIAQMMSGAPENVSGAFDPSLVNPAEARENSWMNLYHLVNRDLNAENMSDYTRHLNAQPAMFMTPEMVDTFNKYYNAGDYASAKAFYDALLPDLETLAANYKTNLEYMLSQNEYAPLMVGERLLTSPVAGVMGTIGSIAALFGDKTARRANSWYYDQTRANNVIQSARADAWAKQAEAWFPGSDFAQNAAKFLNGVVYSMADNLIALGAGKGLSVMSGAANSLAVTEAAVQIIMSSEATASMMKEQLDAGKDGTEAALMALGSGVIEAATEKFSLEALLKPDVRAMMKSGKGFAQYVFKNFLAEGSEEVASDVLTTILDVILSQANGHENELMKEYQALIDQGMGETEATRTVIWNMVQKLGTSFLAGGLSGLVMSASRGGAAKMSLMQENIRLGKAAMNSNVDSYLAKGTEAIDKAAASSLSEGMQAAAAAQTKETKKAEMPDSTKANDKTTREAINKIRLLDTAVKMGPDSESGAIAADMKARIIKGERVSNAEYGALIRSIVNESSEEIGNIARDVMGEQFRQELIEAGEDKDAAEMHTKILLDMIVNNRHSALTAAMLADSPAAQKIMQEYKMRDSYDQYQKETKGWIQAKKSTLEMLGASGTRQQIESMWKRVTNGAKDRMATEEEYNAAEGEKTGSAKEVVYDGKVAEVVGIKTETVNEGGKKMNRVLAVMSNGEEVDMSLVSTRNEGLARILQFAHDDRNEMGSDGWINTVIKHYDESVKNVGAFVQGAMNTRLSSFLGIKTGKPDSMSEEAYKEIKEQADREFDEAEKERVRNHRDIRPGQGKTTFMGVEYGTKEWTKEVKKLDKTQQKEANAIAAIAKSAGFEVELVMDDEHTAEQGSYSATGGVTINLAGTYTKEGAHRSALATFAHELTHWLEGNSQEAYKSVRTFVLGTLQQYGTNLYKEMQRTFNAYAHEGVQLDMAGAVAEMVAKGCEQVLTDENVIRKLQEQDAGLYGKMKEAVGKLISRIRGLRQENIDTSSWYAKMLMNVTDEIADKWMAAYEEAAGTIREAAKASKESKAQKSVREDDAAYEDAVKRGDMETAQQMVDDKYEKEMKSSKIRGEDGKLLPVYHGTMEQFNTFDMDKGRANMDIQGAFFSPWEIDAGGYGENVRRFYLNIQNPAPEGVAYRALNMFKGKNYAGRKAREYLISKGYDGVNNGNEEYIAFYPEQIKLADAVAYDDDGNVIPISKRADKRNQDVRYSIAEEDAEALQKDLEEADGPETHYGDHKQFSIRVTDPDELAFLNGQETVTTFKSMQLIDGKLYPPMAAVVAGSMEDYSELGKWEKAAEHPELIKSGNKFTLNKGKGKGSLDAAYNPYMHSSNLMINDQFSGAWNRPNLVTVECRVPVSELTSGYHAEFAKDAVGWHGWHTGPVASLLRNTKGQERQVMLSRWIQPVRIVPDAEVAAHYKELLDGTDIKVPDNVVTPSLRAELEKAGVAVKETGKVKYSIAEEDGTIRDDDGKVLAEELTGGTITKHSLRSWNEDNENTLFKKLVAAGYPPVTVRKWIHDVNSVAAIIAADKARLDYIPDRSYRFKKPNADVYRYTLDASTLCAKRLLYQGTFNAIQRNLPNTPLRPGDLIELANMMHEMGFQTPCGICYVESRRRHTGNAAEQWLKNYDGEYKPNYAELTTTDGLARLKEEHPQAYKDFIKAMNKRGSGSVKLVQTRTDYRKDLRRMSQEMVEYLNSVGGIRVQSFSDFETPHLIDMMQAVLDMAHKGLKSQGYTKVPNFAWVFGDTGIKINLSLMGDKTGVDSNGNLIFSNTEGMDFDEAMRLRNRYSKNVGTILVGMNEAHIIAAMGDDRIDFIIPFHKSGWSKDEFDRMTTLQHYDDFESYQNERRITGRNADGSYVTESLEKGENNIMPEEYWDPTKNGTENAQIYLEECKKRGLLPKFWNFLVDNGDGSFSLPTDDSQRSQNIRKGYWKTLIDFKMYDNDGNFAPQETVKPNFNMQEAFRVLDEYEGGANTLPVAEPVVERYTQWYKVQHPERTQFSIRDEQDIDVASWMESVPEWSLKTEAEKQLQRNYKSLRMKAQLQQEKIRKAYGELTRLESIPEESRSEDTNKKIQAYRIRMENARTVLDQTEEKLAGITGSEGYARMMFQQNKILQDFLYGRTQGEVRRAVEKLEESAAAVARRIDENQKALDGMKSSGFLKRMKELLGTSTAEQAAADLKKQFHSTWTKAQIRTYLDPIILKMTQGEDYTHDVEQLAGILIESDNRNTYEGLSALRGLTITLGPGAQKELRAQNSSLKEVRARLAGTGITVKYGERSSLETDIEDLRAEFPNIPDMGDEKDALNNFLDWVDGLKEASGSKEFYNERLAETMAVVMQKAAGTAQGIYMPTEAKAQQQVLALIEFVKGLSAETQAAQQTMQEVAEEMKQLRDAGVRARGMADALESDVTSAIEYYNRTAELAEQTAKKNRQDALIEQLKSKHAEQIAKNNEAWRDLIERDKEARATAEKNQKERAKIDMMFRRILKRMNTKDDKLNIPERMRPLARQILELLLNNDMVDEEGFRGKKLTYSAQKPLQEAARLIRAWAEQDGRFDINDLYDMFSDDVASVIMSDISTLDNALTEWNKEFRGDKGEILEARHRILQDISGSIAEIYDAMMKENEVFVNGRSMSREIAAYNVMTGTRGQMHREWTGKLGGIIRTLHKAIVSGNMTPEYFFRTLRNDGLNVLWDEYHRAENRNGLELKKAQAKLAAIAEKYGYAGWDMQKKIRVPFASGDVQMTIGQIMSLYATWQREKTLGPEMSQHLEKGGFYVEQDLRDGILGRTVMQKKAHRVSDAGMARIAELLTQEQKAYVDDVVQYMSSDLSKLGNEASMAAYGIKLYKEKYYFPFQIWNGIKNMKSNDSGAAAQNQAFHPSFSKSRMHGANNALIIGDFNQTVADHIVGMINYATMGLANDTLNKVLNTQMPEDAEDPKVTTKRNVRAILEEAYGRTALQYLMDLKVQLEGGVKAAERSLGDKAISIFRKNAVAGSLSVAFQQPLSYIRAAMMINPKYLAAAMNPKMWKGSYEEMLTHSGVAVIKDMGRFDVGFGQSARDYIMPEEMETKAKKIGRRISDATTVLPELMDRMTWTRMWSACKAEQAALHPEMDPKSEEFLNKVGERFNELMRRTQVYDSTLVRSQNMRSQNYWMKGITSFMAEPTLTLNVLADSVRSALQKENGGKALMAKAGATFLLSAILQALVKGAFSSGRSPDKKKTWLENFLNRFGTNLVNEANPFSMIPGYNDLVSLLKNGELSDDAMGALGKMFTAYGKGRDLITGNGSGDVWRDIEDSAAQMAQLFGNVPAKNIMRDLRAMYNWITGAPYANRATDPAVIRYQAEEAVGNADSLLSAMIQLLTGAGFEAKNATYYERLYQAKKAGREQEANDLVSYLLNGRGVTDETIRKNMTKLAKADEGEDAAKTAQFLIEEGTTSADDYIRDQLKAGAISAEDARRMLQEADPAKDADSIWWTVDRIEYEKANGKEAKGQYYRLWDAMDANKAEEIRGAMDIMQQHGMVPKNIKTQITKQYKQAYLDGSSDEKRRIRDAMQKAYKELGWTAEDADKVIDGWKKDKSDAGSGNLVASTGVAQPSGRTKDDLMWQTMYKNTEGVLKGKGNIDLNRRKVVYNEDGSISTEYSFSFYDEDIGKEVLIPTVVNGQIVSEDEAIDHYYETGEYLGKFNTPEEAEEYAERLHERQDWYYNEYLPNKGKGITRTGK